MSCYCDHAQSTHISGRGLCLAKDCFCLTFRDTIPGAWEDSAVRRAVQETIAAKPLDFSNDEPWDFENDCPIGAA